jgi:hypothetical protein
MAAWQADFFAPAGKLLTVAPWIFVRGNYELCSRTGPGFLYLLDLGSVLLGQGAAQNACLDQNGAAPLLFKKPYLVTSGKRVLAMVDTSNADDTGIAYPGVYNPQMASLVARIAAS